MVGPSVCRSVRRGGAAPSSHGTLGLQTTDPGSSLAQGLWALCHCPHPSLSPSGYIRATGPGLGVRAHLHLLGGESAPGTHPGLTLSWWW